MLTRYIVLLFLASSLVAGQHASPTDRDVVGTWREQGIDYAAYLILRADHSYARVVEARPPDFPQNTLICSGSWHIEGDVLVKDCIVAYGRESEKARRGPERHVEREPLTDFFRARRRHRPISYTSL
jgi:hypothetical protein